MSNEQIINSAFIEAVCDAVSDTVAECEGRIVDSVLAEKIVEALEAERQRQIGLSPSVLYIDCINEMFDDFLDNERHGRTDQ